MDRCLLCLKILTELNSYIPTDSPRWLKLKILTTIEKHFWPIDTTEKILGICHLCWSKLYDFHTFYTTIEEVQSRDIKISFEAEKAKANCGLQMELVQLNAPQHFQTEFTSTEESNFTIEGDFKIEQNFQEDESLLCVLPAMINDEMNVSTEKRKRGRPRKKLNMQENFIKKPKRKRGRPRKYILDKLANIVNHGIFHPNTETKEQTIRVPLQDSSQQTVANAITSIKVKRGRGRPRKTESCTPNFTTAASESITAVISNNKVDIEPQDHTVQEKSIIEDVISNETEKLVHKKQKFSLMKKRRRMLQHKDLIRNYIATSVRCMNFLKK